VLTAVGTALSVAATVHALVNLGRLRRPPADPPPVAEPVTVLLPVRDEAHRVGPCLRSVLAQRDVRDLRIVVLDDGSTDGTVELVRRLAGDDPRVRLVSGRPVPPGWWGKPWACQQLADIATDGDPAGVLVFLDADVVLQPHAVASTTALLRWAALDLLCPYPRQLAGSPAERLVQPLLQWSWLTALPLRAAERSSRPSLAAANGQLLAVDADAYVRAGGHAAVRTDMLEDIALLRAVKRSGGRGTVADGTHLATCRMYDGWGALRDGYAKSLWSAFGSPVGAAAAVGGLGLVYVLPAVQALRGSRVGLLGYVAAVAGRVAVGHRMGSRVWPDALAHPVSVATFGWLTAVSLHRRRSGTLRVSGRPLVQPPCPTAAQRVRALTTRASGPGR
jgi:hypothetical protein